jgi:hypothetical protein
MPDQALARQVYHIMTHEQASPDDISHQQCLLHLRQGICASNHTNQHCNQTGSQSSWPHWARLASHALTCISSHSLQAGGVMAMHLNKIDCDTSNLENGSLVPWHILNVHPWANCSFLIGHVQENVKRNWMAQHRRSNILAWITLQWLHHNKNSTPRHSKIAFLHTSNNKYAQNKDILMALHYIFWQE